jgi:hypothetical protein
MAKRQASEVVQEGTIRKIRKVDERNKKADWRQSDGRQVARQTDGRTKGQADG